MRMSNLFTAERRVRTEMAAERASFGIRHVTVVPTNYRPDDAEESDEATEDGRFEGETER